MSGLVTCLGRHVTAVARPRLRGIVCYSIFMLPPDESRRREIYDRVLREGCDLHAAVEEIAITSKDDIRAVEDILLVNKFATILS